MNGESKPANSNVRRRLNLFDGFILAGAAVNVVVVVALVGYWLTH
jgi:hypothetical protein